MSTKNKRLSVLSDAEQEALYGLPDFDDSQQLEYLSVSEAQLALATSRPGLQAQVYCILQIGYFKAKQTFFRFDWHEVQEDCVFVLSRYFHGEKFEHKEITGHEHYTQRRLIASLFCYRVWSTELLPQLARQATHIVRRDVTPGFVATELIVWLNEHKIVRPGYSTLQDLISETLSNERRRLSELLEEVLDDGARWPVSVRNASSWSACTASPRHWCPSSAFRSRTCCTTPAWRSSIRSTICATSNPIKPVCTCCATPGSATGSLLTTWSTRSPTR